MCPALPALPSLLWGQLSLATVPGWVGRGCPLLVGAGTESCCLCLLLVGLFVCVSLQLSLMFQVFRNGGVFSTDQINVTKLIKCFNTQGEETEGN